MSTQNPQKINNSTEYLVNDGAGNTFWGSTPISSEIFIKQIYNPTTWLDASDVSLITKDGSNLISSVLDKSGNGNSYTPSNSSTKPLYVANAQNGLGGIQFGASSTTNLITPNFTSVEDENFTTITVRKPNTGIVTPNTEVDVANTGYYTSVLNDWKAVCSVSVGTIGAVADSASMGNISKDTTFTSPTTIITSRFGFGKRTLGVDYRILTRPETGTHTASGALTIGTQTPSGFALRGNILEELKFSRYLTDTELSTVLRYLDKKWNVITTEPSLPEARKHFLNSQVVFIGDSLTVGWGTNVGQGYIFNFPNQTMEMIGSGFYSNIGKAGAQTTLIQTNSDKYALPLYSTEYEANVAVVWAGFNDLFHTTHSATNVNNGITNLCNSLKAKGFKVAVVTITPTTSTSPAPHANFETRRTDVNNYIIANYTNFADGLINLTSDALISGVSAPNDTTYFDPDKIHLNKAGYKRVANIAYPVIKTLLNS